MSELPFQSDLREVENKNEKDADFKASSSEEDDEATIDEQEMNEDTVNHEEELKDLEAENEMSIEELRRKYSNIPDVVEENSKSSSESSSEDEESEKETEESDDEEVIASEDDKSQAGLELLLDDAQVREDAETENDDLINDAAAIAESIQPKGNTLSSTSVSRS